MDYIDRLLWVYRQAQQPSHVLLEEEMASRLIRKIWRLVTIGQCGGNMEGTGQELLAVSRSIRPNDGWNVTTTNNSETKNSHQLASLCS